MLNTGSGSRQSQVRTRALAGRLRSAIVCHELRRRPQKFARWPHEQLATQLVCGSPPFSFAGPIWLAVRYEMSTELVSDSLPPDVAQSSTPQAEPAPGPVLPEIAIKPRRAQPFFHRHPWVFATAIAREPENLAPGSEVNVVTHDGQWIARGLYNPASQIRVRLYRWDPSGAIDDAFLEHRIADALAVRQQVFGDLGPDTALRLIASEGDGLSGLTVDRYGSVLVAQLTSRALADRRDVLFQSLQSRLSPTAIVLRTEKGMRSAEGLELADHVVSGELPEEPLWIREHDLQYAVDLRTGQKTGFFLDQRDNRRRVGELARGRRVLDLCCYSGGFALNAARGGAASVLAVDVSEPALQLARMNAERNGLADAVEFRAGDSFKTLESLRAAGQQFDLIVLDPPKLARSRQALDQALRGYHSLNKLAVEVLAPGGILVTCSCTGLVSHEMFLDILARVSVQTGRGLRVLEARGPSSDHPRMVTCLESDYLKCYITRVE